MVKEVTDFSVLDNMTWELPELDAILAEHRNDIAQQTQRMLGLMSLIDGKKTSSQRLVSFADNSDPTDYVTRYQAMVNTFTQTGVIGAYYMPEGHPDLATLVDDAGGWQLDLRRPDRKGTFHIAYVNDSAPGTGTTLIGRQTVFYKAGV